jgi:hypothetical protein
MGVYVATDTANCRKCDDQGREITGRIKGLTRINTMTGIAKDNRGPDDYSKLIDKGS